jgi:putative DNA primase/helicase
MRLRDFKPPHSNEPVEWSLAYAGVGMGVFPVGSRKRPLTEHGLKDASTDTETILSWWTRYPHADAAWAVPADVVVLDLDVGKGDGFRDFAAREGKSAPAIETPAASTPRGGRHLVYSANGAAYRNGVRVNGFAIDLRTAGGFIVLPGARNGRAWLKHLSTPLVPVPAWVQPARARQQSLTPAEPHAVSADTPFARYAVDLADTSVRNIALRVARAVEGERNCILFWAACRFAEFERDGLIDEAWGAELLALAASRAGLPDLEARRTIKSGFDHGRA